MAARLLAAVALALTAAPVAADDRKPNVIVILSDDVGYGEYGFQGNKQIPTPHIDSIARAGVAAPPATSAPRSAAPPAPGC